MILVNTFLHDTHVLAGIVLIFLVLCLSIYSCLCASVDPDVEIGVKSFPVGVEVVVGDPSCKAILIVPVSVSDNKIQISILILRFLV